jgi:hypothetical protein
VSAPEFDAGRWPVSVKCGLIGRPSLWQQKLLLTLSSYTNSNLYPLIIFPKPFTQKNRSLILQPFGR